LKILQTYNQFLLIENRFAGMQKQFCVNSYRTRYKFEIVWCRKSCFLRFGFIQIKIYAR